MESTTTSQDRLLTLREIAEMTRLSVSTLRWMRHEGRGPKTFKVGRRVVAYEFSVREWVAAQAAAQLDPAVHGAA
jgi:predicted DNA-binding transcriptional regulator AlpA